MLMSARAVVVQYVPACLLAFIIQCTVWDALFSALLLILIPYLNRRKEFMACGVILSIAALAVRSTPEYIALLGTLAALPAPALQQSPFLA